jgi:hypothetical protein
MKNNFEQDLKYWFSGKADFRFAPPEILAVVYGIHKKMQGTPKKKAGVPLKEDTRRNQGSHYKADLNSRGRDASKPLD